jgi:hypothetical protein
MLGHNAAEPWWHLKLAFRVQLHARISTLFFFTEMWVIFCFGGMEVRLCTAARTHLYSGFCFWLEMQFFFLREEVTLNFVCSCTHASIIIFFFDDTAICMSSYSYVPGSASWRSWSTTALALRVGWVYHTKRSCAFVRVRVCARVHVSVVQQNASNCIRTLETKEAGASRFCSSAAKNEANHFSWEIRV